MNATRRRYAMLALFLLVASGGGLAIGAANAPGDWYRGLAKPPFNPPDWVFGPTWTVLYVLIAVAGWRVFEAGLKRPLGWWIAQMALNFAWTPLFFTAERIGVALVVVGLMLAAILAFVAASWRPDRLAALLFVPYALWVGYATLLNAAIWWLN